MITDELEEDLRRAFAKAGAGIEVPEAACARLCGRDYHPRRMRRGKVGAIAGVAAVVATGITVPFAVSGNSPAVAAGAKIRLDSYTFTMPAGYRGAHGRLACPLVVGFVAPHRAGSTGVRVRQPRVPAPVKAAASADGGCVGLMLLPAYQPTRAVPDPYALPHARSVRVGDHHGLLSAIRAYVRGPGGRWAPEKPGALELFVQLPAHHGKVRDLVIGSNKLTERELIKIAVLGLSSS